MIFELAHLQIEERRRESDRESLARLARRHRSESQEPSRLQRLTRSRRRAVVHPA